jgi:hypothetical protein
VAFGRSCVIRRLQPIATVAQNAPSAPGPIGVGPQYDTARVYVAAANLDAFVKNFLAVFDGGAAGRTTVNVTPMPRITDSEPVMTPEVWISVFALDTSAPCPFGEERTPESAASESRYRK